MNHQILPANISLKRAYEPPAVADGVRILIDRLWPRGLSKKAAAIDHWLKEVAPSTELRKWFGHEPARWEEFQKRYIAELAHKGDQLQRLRALAQSGPVTLIFAARDSAHVHATVLRAILLG